MWGGYLECLKRLSQGWREGVWRVWESCLEDVGRLSGGCGKGCLEGVGRLSGGCGEAAWSVWEAVLGLWGGCLLDVGRLSSMCGQVVERLPGGFGEALWSNAVCRVCGGCQQGV